MFITLLFIIVNEVSLGVTMFMVSRQGTTSMATLDNIQYSFYDYHVSWEEARIICLGYKSELAMLNSEKKVMFITQQISGNGLAAIDYWIGSRLNFRGYWIWIKDNEVLDTKLFFRQIEATSIYNNKSSVNGLQCLTFFQRSHSTPMFLPFRCQKRRPFICQKDKTNSDENITEVMSFKFENKNLYLYSASSTWFEAVTECRQRNQQIADVATLKLSQSLAAGMLRVRPKAVESVWIAGYYKSRVWTWLSTDKSVSRNELWQDENMASGDCLLLDRHTCNNPTYMSAKCDRKRSFLCQTIQENELEDQPVAVFIDKCQYWIGLSPKNWSEARLSCKELNATLIALDSSLKVNHVMHIMIDNRELLQYIWIDGRRTKGNKSSKISEHDSVWIWESTGKVIMEPEKDFIFWCNDSVTCDNSGDCLNMDSEDFHVPLVYNLNCKNKQKYVCQSWSADCEEQMNEDGNMSIPYKKKRFNETSIESSDVSLNVNLDSINYAGDSYTNTEGGVIERNHSDSQTSFENTLNTSMIMANHESSKNSGKYTTKGTPTVKSIKDNYPLIINNNTDPVMGFKDIIELMVKKIGEKEMKIPFGSDSANEKSQRKTMKVHSIKEDVSKIVQAIMNKNTKISTSSIFSLRSLISKEHSNISMNRKISNQVLKLDITSLNEKTSDKSTFSKHERENLFVNDPKAMLQLSNKMKSAFTNKTGNLQDNIYKKVVTPENRIESTTRAKIINTTKISNILQTLHKDAYKISDKIQLAKVLTKDLNSADHSSYEIVLEKSKNRNIKLWNILLDHILNPVNNITNSNRKVIGYNIKEFPEN